MKRNELAAMIDHTNLKAFADTEAMRKLCGEARENGFAMVAINSAQTALCKALLKDAPVHVGAAISFPLGQTTVETKAFETGNAIQNGADEIDCVVNQTAVKDGDWAYARDEMERIVAACRRGGAICKVIFENCYLTRDEIVRLAEIAREVRPDFIKTSTGFGAGGATVEDVKLMHDTVGGAVKVKAAGGIRDWATCRVMIEAGAQRIGTSAGLKILAEFDEADVNSTRAWDGAAPFVIGSPVSLPNTITMHVQGQRVLRNAFGKILDALDAGGSGDPYAALNKDEADMLRELTHMGFPPLAWYLEAKGVMDAGSLPVLMPGIKQLDPQYFTDFWTVPGYAGSDPESSASKDHIVFRTKVASVHLPEKTAERAAEDGLNGVDDAWKKQLAEGNGAYLVLEDLPRGDNLYLEGLSMIFESGEAKGANLLMGKMMRHADRPGGIVTIGSAYGTSDVGETLSKVVPGDDILLDNSDYIAAQSYYRHQVPEDLSFHAWDQFRDEHGKPVTPQRPPFPVPFTGVGVRQDGDIQGKVINIQALMDESTCPWCADWWRNRIIATKGTDADHRTYFMERCMHGDVNALGNYMVVNYVGALRQALIDLSAWVEKGVEPLRRTTYTLGEDGQIHPEQDVSKRFGIQAIPTLKANGEKCALVKAGECVRFTVDVEVPVGAGDVTEMLFASREKATEGPDETYSAQMARGEGIWESGLTFERGARGEIHTAHAEVVAGYEALFQGYMYRRDWIAKYGVNSSTGAPFTGGYTDPEDQDSW